MTVVVAIIAINLAVTLAGFAAMRTPERFYRFLYIPALVARGENMVGLVLSQFAHASWGHFIFNMISFWFFAPVVVKTTGVEGLLIVYALSSAAADAVVFFRRNNDPNYRCLGASGSVVGVIFAAIVLRPEMSIFFYFIPIPIPAPIYAVAYVAISYYLMKRGEAGISHDAHMGGAVGGFATAAALAPAGAWPLIEHLLRLAGVH